MDASIWFRGMKKTSSLIEYKEAQRTYTHHNPKKAHPAGEFTIVAQMVAVCCFVWPLALRLWSVSEAVRQE